MKNILLAATLSMACATVSSAATAPSGVQTNVTSATVASWGYSECFSSTYRTATSSLISSELSGCAGDNIIVAARETGSNVFALLGAATKDFLSTFTTSGNTTVNHNGIEWYNVANSSFGFAGAGDTVSRSSCDTNNINADLRLCWHTSGGGGWRAGATTGLNGSIAWEKVLLSGSSVSPVPVPAALPLMLIGLGSFGFMARRRKNKS